VHQHAVPQIIPKSVSCHLSAWSGRNHICQLSYHRREYQRRQDSVLLPRRPIENIIRIIRRLRNQDSLAVFRKLHIRCIGDCQDLEIAVAFIVDVVALVRVLRDLRCCLFGGGVCLAGEDFAAR